MSEKSNQSTPEIEWLETESANHTSIPFGYSVVPTWHAIQAVRDTEDRTVREVVEALRAEADMLDPSDCLPPEDHYPTFRGWQGAAQFIERTFLSPDNPEGNA